MWSAALDIILTTLRYLAPATLLTLFWGQQSFLYKLLKHIDSAFRAIVFSSEEQKQDVLKWLAEAGPVRVEHLDTVWRHGWILCGVLDAALPGACAGHPPTRLSLKHAQTIADHYLGVEPVFSRQELETNDALSKHQEWKLATYLDRIRQALTKITPPVSKPPSQRTSPDATQFSLDYVARGSGLTAAQVNNKMYFKIYPTSQQCLDPGEITILIRGPKDTYGMTVLLPILGKAQMIRHKLLGIQSKSNYTENALPITQGTTYLRNYGKNDMNKTYHIPKSKYDIEIEEEICDDHTKISYVVYLEGKHEISITSKGRNIINSPFTMTASKNIIGILENDTFNLEDGEEIDIIDDQSNRKVVLRIVDFVTEKMLLNENGSLERISDDEAKFLMSTDKAHPETSGFNFQTSHDASKIREVVKAKSTKFKSAANKVVKMNRICKIIHDFTKTIKNEPDSAQKENIYIRQRTHQKDIPDIVNSTFSDSNYNPFVLPDKRDKFIIPENISVSLRTEKSIPSFGEKTDSDAVELTTQIECNSPDSLETCESLQDHFNDDILVDRPPSSNNPFFNDMFEENYDIEKDLGSFVKTEYETNNSQNEEINAPIKITVQEDECDAPSPINVNPFIEPDVINLERPKTPVLKIITGEVKGREDSVYVDPKTALISDEILGNEFINPFFIHHHQSNESIERLPIVDFIIGAPVSLPPIVRAQTPEPDMKSIIITNSNETKNIKKDENDVHKNNGGEISTSVVSTPLHANINNLNTNDSSTFHSLDSNTSDSVDILSLSNASDIQEPYQIGTSQSDRNVTPKKDMWDSAYVSIDDNNSSPDSNNNENLALCETSSKQKSDNTYEFLNMGPAEREIWQTCYELKQEIPKIQEEVKPNKWETKRSTFTPIIEESDRSISSAMKDMRKSEPTTLHAENDTVTVAFAELNDMYHAYFPAIPPNNNTTMHMTVGNIKQKGSEHHIERTDVGVDSASVNADVKRHTEIIEGKISEVQSNVTESVLVSQPFHDKENMPHQHHRDNVRTLFGNSSPIHTNIVLEKKQYWDERIREIEAKSEENRAQQKKRRLTSRHLRHNDSLTKRRGKQIVKNFLSAGEKYQTVNVSQTMNKPTEITNYESITSPVSIENVQTDTKLVEKWKKYWDSKLELEKDESETTCFRTKSPSNKEKEEIYTLRQKHNDNDIIEVYKEIKDNKIKTSSSPVKQELPEEVFKAFETSPKRFFGTSRKQILNKIDTFLGKPSTADESSTDVSGACCDTGLVSSRISLFHNISQTEEPTRRKCQSMHNIFQRKDSERSTSSIDEKVIRNKEKEITHAENSIQNNCGTKQNAMSDQHDKIETCVVKQTPKDQEIISLKDKRSRLMQKVNYKTFDDSVYKKVHQNLTATQQVLKVKNTIIEYNKHNRHQQKYEPSNVLRKTSISKSDMDIFNKFTNKPGDDDLDKYKSCEELPKINVKNFISLYESVSKTDIKSKSERKMNKVKYTGLQHNSHISSSSGTVHNMSPYSTATETPTSENYTYTVSNTELTMSPRNWVNKHGENNLEPRSLDSVDIEIISIPDIDKEHTSMSDLEIDVVEPSDKSSVTKSIKGEEAAHVDYKSRFKMAKQFFQSLEELRDVKKPRKLNECELLLEIKSTESLENERPQKRTKKNIKAHSVPSTEIAKIWNQLQESENSGNTRLVKISEKFNVEDLFNDVTKGRLSRQGSLRGIPHKKAVLETFKSMENLANNRISSYEIAVTQLHDFAEENKIKNAQTYLSEYPYLPTTDPSKYQSRLDAKASGLISLKELLIQKPRRNSVPDLRMNTKFTENL